MRKINIFYILILLVVFIDIQKVCAETITLNQIINIVLKNNPELKAIEAKLGINDAQILKAKTRINPLLISDSGIAEKTYRVGIQQTIEVANKRKKRINLAQTQKEVALNEKETYILELKVNVKNAYIELYNAQQKYNITNEILNTTKELFEVAKKRQIAGDIALLDVLQAEITMINVKNNLENAKLGIIKSFNILNAFTGETLDNDIILMPANLSVQNNTIEKLKEKAYFFRPEIKGLMQQIEITKQQIEIAKTNIIPNLVIGAGPSIIEENNKIKANLFITTSLELPIFDYQQGAINEALAQKIQLEKELEVMKNKISLEIKNAFSQINSTGESIKIYENELIPKANDVVNKSRRSFEEGKSNIVIPLNAQQSYINIKFDYIQTLIEYQKAINNLERAVGGVL